MIWLIKGLIITASGLASMLTAGIYFFQEKLLYMPNLPGREYDELPSDYLLPYEDLEILTSDNIKLHSWLIKQNTEDKTRKAPTLLYFHGNAGNISHRLEDVRNMYNRIHCNVLMVSYRGYGRSEGSPNEVGFIRDAKAVYEFAAVQHPVIKETRLFLFGRSIGGAVCFALAHELSKAAAAAAATGSQASAPRILQKTTAPRAPLYRPPISGIIVENTFISISEMIDHAIPILRWFKFLNRNKWDTMNRIKGLDYPMLFLSGLEDEIVPPSHMKMLYHAAEKSAFKKIELFPNATHNDTWYVGGNRYYDSIKEFLERCEEMQRS